MQRMRQRFASSLRNLCWSTHPDVLRACTLSLSRVFLIFLVIHRAGTGCASVCFLTSSSRLAAFNLLCYFFDMVHVPEWLVLSKILAVSVQSRLLSLPTLTVIPMQVEQLVADVPFVATGVASVPVALLLLSKRRVNASV